jgi:hypothetical protein
MVSCFIELALAGWGVYLLSTGQASTPGGRRIKGSLVRLAGVVFMLPFPLCFLIGFYMGFKEGIKGHQFDIKKHAATLMMVEMGIIFLCGAVGAVMLWMASQQPEEIERVGVRERPLSDREFERIFTANQTAEPVAAAAQLASANSDSVMEVIPVSPAAAQGVTALPPPLPRPALREEPRPRQRDEFDEFPVRQPRPRRERGINPAVILAAIALFIVVAVGGAVLMK